MFHGFFLGILGGAVAAKLWSRGRFGGGGGCGTDGGGCGRGGWRGGHRHGWGRGAGFGGFGLFGLLHELNLSPEQWQKGQEILRELRGTLHEGKAELRGSAGPLLRILATEEWNGARAEEVAKQHDALFGRVRANGLSALERLHRLLTPEQRERLRRFVSETGPAADSGTEPRR